MGAARLDLEPGSPPRAAPARVRVKGAAAASPVAPPRAPHDRVRVKAAAAVSPLAPPRAAIEEAFYARDAKKVAPDLLGAYLVVNKGGTERAVRIVETEAYCGPADLACHARAGLTRRTRSLFGPPGHAYVFLVYGMHECFNIVCFGEGKGHAVLVRAGEPVCGIAPGARTDGPGRVTRALGLSREDDGAALTRAPALIYVAPRDVRVRICKSPRVGVAYAGEVANKPWRFFDRESPHVSRPPPRSIGLG